MNILKGFMALIAVGAAIPILIILIGALLGFGGLLVVAPQLMAGLVIFLMIISIPALIIGYLLHK